MTIAAGVMCSNGIVIAADGEVTRNLVKANKVKSFDLVISEHVSIIGVGAGDEIFVDSVTQKLKEQLDFSTPDLVCVKDEIEKLVRQACEDACRFTLRTDPSCNSCWG